MTIDKLMYVLSGEFVLTKRPNGGTAVLLRSLWVTLLIYSAAMPLKSYCAKGAVFQFSLTQLQYQIGETLPWLGAIFAGAYAALYSRFAAQWGYLAGLYNQIMAVCVPLSEEQRKGNRTLTVWRAAFVEDAQDLHLARKSMFKAVIIGLLEDQDIVEVFLSGTANGEDRLKVLERQLDFKAARPLPVTAAPLTRSVDASPASVVIA